MFNTAEQSASEMLIHPTLDERNRQGFAKHLREFVFGPAKISAQRDYVERVEPALEKAQGAPVRDRHAAREALLKEPSYTFFCDLHRVSQEMLWSSVIDTIDRERSDLEARFASLRAQHGSLTLNPGLQVPEYLRRMDTHVMPGSYHADRGPSDVSNGALYDRGAFLYAPGGGPLGDGAGRTSLAFLRAKAPAFQPRRILDLGCATGGPMLPYAEAFPDAELHGLDIGAALLRYAHLRFETLGIPAHFHQIDAAATGLPAGHFDLITSHIMFHETSAESVPSILAEVHRLLAAGGIFVMVDLPDANLIPDVFQQVVFEGDAYYNNEHFWMRMHDLDWPAMLRAAGFPSESIAAGFAPTQLYTAPTGDGQPARWTPGRFGFFGLLARKGAEG